MKYALSAALAIACLPAVAAEPKVVGELAAPSNTVVSLKIDGVPDGAAVQWDVTPEDRASVARYTAGPALEFTGPDGVYKVKATVIVADWETRRLSTKVCRETVTIGGPPRPGPVVPPKPDDKPRRELSPLAKEFKGLVNGESREDLMALSELYKLMAKEAARPEYVTPLQLNLKYQEAARALVGAKLMPCRQRASAEVVAVMPADANAAMTDAVRAAVSAAYLKLSNALEEVTNP